MKKNVFLFMLLVSCNMTPKDLSTQSAKEISDADMAMNDLAAKDGFNKALLQYAEDSVIMPREGKQPIMGKAAAMADWGDKPGSKDISWKPYRAVASASGDIGYTFGFWQYKTKDTTTYGDYCTVWHKQKDGTWKFIYDGGHNMSGPWNNIIDMKFEK